MPCTAISFQDLHIADRGPPYRKDDYHAAVQSKLEQIQLISQRLRTEATFNCGDLFNSKQPMKNSHALVQQAIDFLKGLSGKSYSIVGNHDITKDALESLSKQPMGTVLKSGVTLRAERDYSLGLGHDFYNGEDCTCFVAGIDFRRGIQEVREKLDRLNNLPLYDSFGRRMWVTVLLHQYANPGNPGSMFGEESLGYEELKESRIDVFCMGHDHAQYGCIELAPNKYIIRPGSPIRGSIAQEDIRRQPAIAIIKYNKDTIQAQTCLLKHTPSEEIFDFVLKQEQAEKKQEENQFIEALNNTEADEGVNLWDWLQQKDMSNAVRSKVHSLLTENQVVREGAEVAV